MIHVSPDRKSTELQPNPTNPQINTITKKDPQNPHDAPPNACCTYSLCCGLRGGWRDLVMFTVEGTSVGATVVALALKAWYPAIGIGVVGLSTLAVHVLWHRDGDLADMHKIVDKLENTEKELELTAVKTDETVKNLQTQNDQLEKEKTALLQAQGEFEKQRLQFNSEVQGLHTENLQIVNENKELSKANQTLKTEIGQLQETIKAIKSSIERFNQQNQVLKKNVGTFSDEVIDFGHEDDSLKKVLANVDKEIDEDVAQLAEQVSLAQKTSHEIFASFSGEIKALTEQVSTLKKTIAQLDQDSSVIQTNSEQLKTLQIKISEAEGRLQSREAEFGKINQALTLSKNDLAATLKKIEASDAKLSGDTGNLTQVTMDLATIASHMDALGDRMEKDIDDLKTIKSKTDQQEKEINNL